MPDPAPDTITVTVLDRAAQARAWGRPGGGGLVFRTLTLPRYTARGERRSDPERVPYCEDGEHYAVSRWTLDSGRVETYAEAIAAADEARAPAPAR